MTIGEVLALLEQKAPSKTAEPWDNSGLLVGNAELPVEAVLVTLDITHDSLDRALAVGAQLVVSHHPVIFEALRALTPGSVPYRLVQHGIAALCVHTNLDKAPSGVNDCLAQCLGLESIRVTADGMSRLGDLPEPLSGDAFARRVARCLGTSVRARTGDLPVRTVALCGGAGADLVLPLLEQADAALTGEVKHHEWLAVPPGKTMVDGGHYATEVVVVRQLASWLRTAFPQLAVTEYEGKAPYYTVKD